MSRTIKLDAAVREISSAISPTNTKNPFYFVVGAGISSPAIPTANTIINTCKKAAPFSEDEEMESIAEGADQYSYWLQRAFPQPKSRREFFRNLIENKSITTANFKLAHLLSKGNIGKVVITPNFDNFLAKALTLFNSNHLLCDHPGTAFKIDAELDEIQLVHIHGNYLSYDCCNLTVEINDRSAAKQMVSMLDRIGSSRSPIVVGYSGWENDIIMTYLKSRLSEPFLPYNLYWFCYTDTDLNSLPLWLTSHNNVVFVIPEDVTNSPLDDDLNLGSQAKNFLSAEEVFETLIQKFDLEEPEITKNPLNFLINLIKGTEDDDSNNDVLFLNHVIQRLEQLQVLEQKSSEMNLQYSKVQTLRSLIISSKYEASLKLLDSMQIEPMDLEEYQKIELIEILAMLILKVKPAREVIITCELMEKTFDSLIESHDKDKYKYSLGLCLLKKADVYGFLIQIEDQLKTLNYVFEKYREFDSLKFKNLLADVLIKKAAANIEIGKLEDGLKCYEEVLERFDHEENPDFKIKVGISILNKCQTYLNTEDFKAARKEVDIFLSKFEHFESEVFLFLNATILHLNTIISLELTNETGEDVKIPYIKLINRFEEKNDSTIIQKYIIMSTFHLARHYYYLQQEDEAIVYFDYLLDKSNDLISDPKIKEIVGETCAMYGLALYNKKKIKDSFETFKMGTQYNNPYSQVNLAYMLRRGEGQGDFNIIDLLDKGIENDIPIAYVNKALSLVMNNWDERQWKEADNIIKNLKTYSKDVIESIETWWHELLLQDDTEGHLVIGWLTRHNLISDPEGLTLKERLNKATRNHDWYVQRFMYEEEIDIIPST